MVQRKFCPVMPGVSDTTKVNFTEQIQPDSMPASLAKRKLLKKMSLCIFFMQIKRAR